MEQQIQLALPGTRATEFRWENANELEPEVAGMLPDDHAFPMAFVLLPALVGTLLWLLTMLSRLAPDVA